MVLRPTLGRERVVSQPLRPSAEFIYILQRNMDVLEFPIEISTLPTHARSSRRPEVRVCRIELAGRLESLPVEHGKPPSSGHKSVLAKCLQCAVDMHQGKAERVAEFTLGWHMIDSLLAQASGFGQHNQLARAGSRSPAAPQVS